MLILSRRNGESFVIGDNIKITVLSQRSNQVRIGIEAPRSLPVHREEVLLRNQQQAQQQAEKHIAKAQKSANEDTPSSVEKLPKETYSHEV